MSGKRKKTRVNVSLDPELYRRAKALGLNVSGVSERALREYVDRLENGSGQSSVLVGTNGPDGSNDTSDDTADDTDANDDTEAEYADTPTEEVLDDYRQFATSVLDRSGNTVQLHTRYIERLLEHADTPPSQVTQADITPALFPRDTDRQQSRTVYISQAHSGGHRTRYHH